MSAPEFRVVGARPETFAASPLLLFDVEIAAAEGRELEGIALRTQIRIEPQRRPYSLAEEAKLLELFGERRRWQDTLRPFVWGHVSHFVPRFAGSHRFCLPFPCSYDLEVSAAKYLHALADGTVPIRFLFSGMLYANGARGLEVDPVPWTSEASYALPVKTWCELMDHYFPGTGWLRLRRETLDQLLRAKAERALATFDDVILRLVEETKAPR